MPATRSQIRRSKIVEQTVDFGEGVTVTFTIDANKMTDGWMADFVRHEEESNVPQINAMLVDLIERWDIVEDEGGALVPVNEEEIGKLFSMPDKVKLMKAFAVLPSDAEGNASRNISSTPSTDSMSEQASLQNGQQTSQTPTPLASPSSTS
jgi:hypothetical protein